MYLGLSRHYDKYERSAKGTAQKQVRSRTRVTLSPWSLDFPQLDRTVVISGPDTAYLSTIVCTFSRCVVVCLHEWNGKLALSLLSLSCPK